MPSNPNLPGSNVAWLDGGLNAAVTFADKATLVIGTSATGPVGSAVQVTNPSVSSALYGIAGTIVQAISEVLLTSDNVLVWRLGTSPAILSNIGLDTDHPGFVVTAGQRQANAGSIYQIWYSNGAIYLWLNGNLVYADDPYNNVSEDSGDSLVSGSAVAGQNLCVELGSAFQDTFAYAVGAQVKPATYTGFNYKVTATTGVGGAAEPTWNNVLGATTVSGLVTFEAVYPSTPSPANALTLVQAAAVTPQLALTAPTLVAAVDGTGMTAKQTYVALAEALDLLSTTQVSQVYCPNVLIDTPNVAFYVVGDATTAFNNPATNPNTVLDWLQTTTDIYGNNTYTWAGTTALASPAARLAAGYHEVNFGYLLARFAAAQQEELGGCVAFIGTQGPGFYNGNTANRYDLLSTRKWVGALPQYSPITGNPTSFGYGLSGIPYLVGTTSSKLNPLTTDFSSGYRLPGFFENDANEYDGGANTDINGNPIDIGQFLHVVYDQAQLGNAYSAAYIGNLAGVVAGEAATLDQTQALTYKTLLGTTPIWTPNFAQMNALSFAKVNGLRGDETVATLIHDNTAALATSDWFTLYNVNLRFMISNIAFTRGKTFLGTGALNGLQATALTTALDADASVLQTRGYISSCQFVVTTTAADARIGQAAVNVLFSAPGQLRILNFSIGITASVAS